MKKIITTVTSFLIAVVSSLSLVSCGIKEIPNSRPINWYTPHNTKDGSASAFANDACSILWDEEKQLFYSWMLFRNGKNFTSGWVEMTSPDLNVWTQGEYRIQQGKHFDKSSIFGKTSAYGGSVWVDSNGKYFDKGDVVFVMTMRGGKLIPLDEGSKAKDMKLGSSGIAYYVSHGLGQEIYTSGVLAKKGMNTDETKDWRDTAVFQTDDGLYFAISANNRVEFWRINHFGNKPKDEGEKIEKVNEIFVRNIGVEVPNVVRIDKNLWYVSASVQDNPFKGPFQSAWWTLCEWDKDKGFTPVKKGDDNQYHEVQNIRTVEAAIEIKKEQPKNKVIDWSLSKKYKDMVNVWTPNEYGTEGYAQRVVDPWQTQHNLGGKYPKFAIARSMAHNWAYNTNIWAWKGGLYGSEKIDFTNIDNGNLIFTPYDEIGDFANNGTAVYELKGSDFKNGYTLKFNNENFTFTLSDGAIIWNNEVTTKLKKWTKQGGPTDLEDSIKIVWNRTTLTFWNETKGWNAHFMLPQGTTHKVKSGAMSII
ncbi:hypothetical protein CG001_00050 [Mesoplasma coleopterae]|uniref:hypothetical protein n=1 Tax=Mesoplasma coleopterae TaxID=324078 RepID=UPI000D02A057|nr:hypothetical protein [Mesoplasma coleopterae]AVN62053.1 hypothetical protein CG001_00050 [Mesoplasma coleopterae]